MTFHMPAFLPDHRFAEWCCTVVVSLTAAGVLAAAEPTPLPLLTHITSTDDLGDVRSVARRSIRGPMRPTAAIVGRLARLSAPRSVA